MVRSRSVNNESGILITAAASDPRCSWLRFSRNTESAKAKSASENHNFIKESPGYNPGLAGHRTGEAWHLYFPAKDGFVLRVSAETALSLCFTWYRLRHHKSSPLPAGSVPAAQGKFD
jgi:hypothetical protein